MKGDNMRSVLLLLVAVSLAFASVEVNDVSPNAGTPGGGSGSDALLDPLDYIDLEALGTSVYCVGVGFDGTNLWVTDGTDLQIYIISPAGVLVDQVSQSGTSGWGLRDLCWNGTYMFGSQSNQVQYYDATYSYVNYYNCYACNPNRAQGFDGTYFYTGSFAETIYQVTWDGVAGSTAAYTTWSTDVGNGGTYGAAYDDFNECIWVSTASSDYMIYQIDMSGNLIDAHSYSIYTAGGCTPGDLDGYPGQTQLWVLEQGSPDALHCLELQPVALERDTWAGIKTLI